MKTIRTIELDGSTYSIPAGMTDTQLANLCGQLLLLQRVEYCCDRDYLKTFHYVNTDAGARVRLGTQATYATKDDATAARDAYNATLPEKESA